MLASLASVGPLILVLLGCCLAEVFDLEPDNFCPAGMPGTWVVKFYSPYCGGCTKYAPVFQESVTTLENEKANVQFGQVDCVRYGDFCTDQKIRGWPSLRVYRSGEYFAETKVNMDSSDVLVKFVRELPADAASASAVSIATIDNSIALTPPSVASGAAAAAIAGKQDTVHSVKVAGRVGDPIVPATTAVTAEVATAPPSATSAYDLTASMVAAYAEASSLQENDKSTASTPAPTNSVNTVEVLNTLSEESAPGLYFIKFFSPYCHHCKEYAPIWKKIAAAHPGAKFAEINCIENGDLCKTEEITMWPVVRAYQDGCQDKEFTERQFNWKGTNKWLKKNYEMEPVYDFNGEPVMAAAEAKASVEVNTTISAESTAVETTTIGSIAASATATQLTTTTAATAEASTAAASYFIPQNLPPLVWTDPIPPVTHADGKSTAITRENYDELVKNSGEPWMIKFFHPQCPHCQAMAPEWEKYAVSSADRMNVGQISCETDFEFCLEQGISSYPTIFFYLKDSKHMFVGPFEASAFEKYDKLQAGAQILQVRDSSELSSLIDVGSSDGVGTFVYLYDESITDEDWGSLSEQALKFPNFKSTIFHSSNPELRKEAKIEYQGSTLVYAGKWVNPATKELDFFFYSFPHANTPKKLRDTEAVVEWANTVRFSSPIELDPSQVPALSRHASAHVLQIVDDFDKKLENMTQLAKMGHEENMIKQSQNQAALRDQRTDLADKYRKEGKASIARSVQITPINAPYIAESSYGFITQENWNKLFSRYLDTSAHQVDDIVVIDWYNGKYVDKLGDEKLTLDDIGDARKLFTEANPSQKPRKFQSNFRKLPKPFHPQVVFKPDFNLGQNIATMQKRHLSLSGVILAALAFFLGRPLFKRAIRYWRSRSSRQGPLLSGKMD